MIAYHGGPFSDATIATEIWQKHHALQRFAGVPATLAWRHEINSNAEPQRLAQSNPPSQQQ